MRLSFIWFTQLKGVFLDIISPSRVWMLCGQHTAQPSETNLFLAGEHCFLWWHSWEVLIVGFGFAAYCRKCVLLSPTQPPAPNFFYIFFFKWWIFLLIKSTNLLKFHYFLCWTWASAISTAPVTNGTDANSCQLCSRHQSSTSKTHQYCPKNPSVRDHLARWPSTQCHPSVQRPQRHHHPYNKPGAGQLHNAWGTHGEQSSVCNTRGWGSPGVAPWGDSGQVHWPDHGGWCRRSQAGRQTGGSHLVVSVGAC